MIKAIRLVLFISLVGCDPVRSTEHVVSLVVSNGDGVAQANLLIELKEMYGLESSEVSDWQREKYWESLPWHSSRTDEGGYAVIRIVNTSIDKSHGSRPPAKSNIVGREYAVRLEGKSIGNLKLIEDAEVHAGDHNVRVYRIANPRYISTK